MSDLQYIEAPNIEKPKYPSIFLAGGITNCPDWQSELVEHLENLLITVFNPRRKNFPINDPAAAEEQIAWEYHRLREVDAMAFWFSRGSDNPIVLFEYGTAMERIATNYDSTQSLLVGMDMKYSRFRDVQIQTELRLGAPFANSIAYELPMLATAIIGWLGDWHAEKETS